MLSKKFLPLLRELSDTFHAFGMYSAAHIRGIGLTPPQFDIVATLGNTQGMSPKELGEKTLITKGTLTGVVDRLIEKGLVSRTPSTSDGRCMTIKLTKRGERLFGEVFPAHLAHLQPVFGQLKTSEIDALTLHLRSLRAAFDKARDTLE
ncbi:MAG: MarR family transcriptional regulator [Gallionella sp.]|nr:MarR family transcriptional regulator [Gallionella sp.]